MLKPGGALTVWHALSREQVNEIHASAGSAVAGDVLPPASELAAAFAACGIEPKYVIDDSEHYLVRGSRAQG